MRAICINPDMLGIYRIVSCEKPVKSSLQSKQICNLRSAKWEMMTASTCNIMDVFFFIAASTKWGVMWNDVNSGNSSTASSQSIGHKKFDDICVNWEKYSGMKLRDDSLPNNWLVKNVRSFKFKYFLSNRHRTLNSWRQQSLLHFDLRDIVSKWGVKYISHVHQYGVLQ